MHPSLIAALAALIAARTPYDGFVCDPSRTWCAIPTHEQPDETPWQNRDTPRMTAAPVFVSGAVDFGQRRAIPSR